MASIALEEKINKIRQQNEEIRRRYEEVEEDKKNAAKLNALVQMVPSTDWPERKEPPEFANPPKPKQKAPKDKHDYISQSYNTDGKRSDGPPPDPKYNFLADSEREEVNTEHTRENVGPRTQNKVTRGNFRKRGTGRDNTQKDNRVYKGNYREEYQPGYEAWRAERNRIDEDRISRQRTAEGNWRREWDNNKMHIVDDVTKSANRPTLGDFSKKDHKDFDRRYHANGGDYSSHSRGGSHRPYRGTMKNFHGNYENRSHNTYDQYKHNPQMSAKTPLSPTSPNERTVVGTDKGIKVTLNQSSASSKGPVMSVKVNLPSIAGTGRVGPRQRTRVTYSQSDADIPPEVESFSRQKSFDEKLRNPYFNNQKATNLKRSHSQKKKNETGSKSPYLQRKRDENDANVPKYHDNEFRSVHPEKPYSASKSPQQNPPTKISGTDQSDASDSLKKEDNHSSDATEESVVKESIANAIQSEENENGCEIAMETGTNDLQVNNIPIEDSVPSSIESDKMEEGNIDTGDCNTSDDDPHHSVAEATEQIEESHEEAPDTLKEISNDTECITKDVPTASATEAEIKVPDDTPNSNEENVEGKSDPSSSNCDPKSMESQPEEVSLNHDITSVVESENVIQSNSETDIVESPKEIAEPSPIINCDNDKEATIAEGEDGDAVKQNSICSSKAEMCAVIVGQEEAEHSQDTDEKKDDNKTVVEDCPENTDDVQAAENTDNAADDTKEKENVIVESQNKVLVELKEENVSPVQN